MSSFAASVILALVVLSAPCVSVCIPHLLRRSGHRGRVPSNDSLIWSIAGVFGQVILPVFGGCAGFLGASLAAFGDDESPAYRTLQAEAVIMRALFDLSLGASTIYLATFLRPGTCVKPVVFVLHSVVYCGFYLTSAVMSAISNSSNQSSINPSETAAFSVGVSLTQLVALGLLAFSPPVSFPKPPHLPSGLDSAAELSLYRQSVVSIHETRERTFFWCSLVVSQIAALIVSALNFDPPSEGKEIVQSIFTLIWAAGLILPLSALESSSVREAVMLVPFTGQNWRSRGDSLASGSNSTSTTSDFLHLHDPFASPISTPSRVLPALWRPERARFKSLRTQQHRSPSTYQGRSKPPGLDEEFQAVDEAMLSELLFRSLDVQAAAPCTPITRTSPSTPLTPLSPAFNIASITPTPTSPTQFYRHALQAPRSIGDRLTVSSDDTVMPAHYRTVDVDNEEGRNGSESLSC